MLRNLLFCMLAAALPAVPAVAADASSVGADGTVTIRPGEAFEIAFPDRNDLSHPGFSRALDHVDDKVAGYRKPDPGAPPQAGPALMSFELRNEGAMLELYVRNDTGVAVKYDATMITKQSDGKLVASHTSVCPSLPGMLGTEMWAETVVSLKLAKFHKSSDDDLTCE